MYYVFFETGNKQFFSDLVRAFCLIYVQNIVDFYNSVKQEKSGILDWMKMEKHIDANGKGFDIFNCAQHLMTADCPNNACWDGHTTVLAEDQQHKIEDLMQDVKNKYCRKHYPGDKKKIWREIQGIFQHHSLKTFFKVEVLHFQVNDDPDKYMDTYVEKTNKKSPADGYAYVCAPTGSDYIRFMGKTELDNVVACNSLQVVP